MKPFYIKLLSISLISCLGVIVYSNTFNCSFHFDDQSFIIGNDAIKDIGNLPHIWEYYPCRFLTFLSLALDYHFHQLDLAGYHAVNLVIHLISAILVWWLTLLTLSTTAIKGKPLVKNNSSKKFSNALPGDSIAQHADFIALFAGLVFVSHPLQVESVTYIWQRATSMAVMFYLFSLIFYVKSSLLAENKSKVSLRRLYYVLSLAAAVAAMLTKEIALTLPLIMVLYEFTFLKDKGSLNWKKLSPFLLTILIIPLVTLLTNSDKVSYIHGSVQVPGGLSAREYLLTQLRVIVTYIRLFFLPIHQNLDYDYPVSRSIFELPTCLSSLFLIAVLFLAQRLFIRHRLISFSILWIFLTSLTEALPYPVKDVIFEHRLYLPMMGYSLFLVSAVYYLGGKKNITMMVFVLMLMIGCNSILTFQRNKAWRDELTMMDDIIQKSPHKSRPYTDRGFYHEKEGNFSQALSDYTKAIELKNPVFEAPYNNRGVVYSKLKDYPQALSDFNKAIEINPGYEDAYKNRAITYSKEGRLIDAISDYNKAIEIGPKDEGLYYNRGLLFVQQNDFVQALLDFKKVIELNPANAAAYNNCGRIYDIQGNFDQAVSDYSKAIELDPSLSQAYDNRSAVYDKLKSHSPNNQQR